ncbi:hypothetical protein LXL04_023488 [Taraxacum kok-saghyz]
MVPPDIGDFSKTYEEMENTDEAEFESLTKDRADLHGPIKSGKNQANEKRNSFETKSLRKQRHLNNVEKQKLAKVNYEAQLLMKSDSNSVKVSAGSSSIITSTLLDDHLIGSEMQMNDGEDRNDEAKRSKLSSQIVDPSSVSKSNIIIDTKMSNKDEGGILVSEDLIKAWNHFPTETEGDIHTLPVETDGFNKKVGEINGTLIGTKELSNDVNSSMKTGESIPINYDL